MKKTLAIILAIALLCIMAVGTTLTYFSDDDSDVNTMTVGDVKIEQITSFSTSNLYPYIGEIPDGEFETGKNAHTKTVSVKSTGSEAAYIRTLFAFEAVNGADPVATNIIYVNYNKDTAIGNWVKEGTETIEVKGVQYYVYSFTYAASYVNAETPASLKQIALDRLQGNEFSTYVNGKYDILVLSQAVQAQGFNDATTALNAAFGEVNASNAADWFTNLPNN